MILILFSENFRSKPDEEYEEYCSLLNDPGIQKLEEDNFGIQIQFDSLKEKSNPKEIEGMQVWEKS